MKTRLALLWLLLVMLAKGEAGIASFIDPRLKGHPTASGEAFLPERHTAASWKYFRRWLKVTNVKTGHHVTVYVNDKGPAKTLGRLIDLSPAAFASIGRLEDGLMVVRIEPLF